MSDSVDLPTWLQVAHATGGAPVVDADSLARRAARVIWKGGRESGRHPALRDCGFPRFLSHGAGCQIWDAEGRCYVDYLMTWGTVLLGHAHPEVDAAVARQAASGGHLNLPFEQEVALAERLVRHVPGVEQIRFLTTGAEATNAAVRIARAATGRDGVIQYGFHGWLDWCQAAHPAGVPEASRNHLHSFAYGDLDSLQTVFEQHPTSIACVIMEPMKEMWPPDGYLEQVRALVHDHGALLVFDEAKTGFRFGLGGAQEHFGVTPDLSVFSKALANGYPLAAVGGATAVLDAGAGVWVSGTYHGWPPAIAAAHAVLNSLEREPIVERVWRLGRRLTAGVNEVFSRYGLDTRLIGAPCMPQLHGPECETERQQQIISEMLLRGHFLHPVRPWFISAAHDEATIDATIDDLESATQMAVQR